MANKTVIPKKRKLRIFSLFLAIVLLLSGVGLIYISANPAWELAAPAQKQPQQVEPVNSVNYPLKLNIPKLSRTLDIIDGKAVENRWTVSDSGVSYLTTSALPGTKGNTVLYGHNKKNILGPLPSLSLGDRIEISLTDGKSIIYEVFEKKEIKPTQVEILKDTDDSRLTIYTCSGFLDQSRYVVIARQIST